MQSNTPDNYTHFDNHDREMARLEDAAETVTFDDLSPSEQEKIDAKFFERLGAEQFVVDAMTSDVQATVTDLWSLLESINDIQDSATIYRAEDFFIALCDLAQSTICRNKLLQAKCRKVASDWIEYRNEQVDEL